MHFNKYNFVMSDFNDFVDSGNFPLFSLPRADLQTSIATSIATKCNQTQLRMGNAVSETSPLYTADELKWKSGAVADSIPSLGIGKVTTYENLHASAVFKDYLIKHIDSDYLISSIMSSSDDDAILLKGIEKFKNLEPEWIDSLHKLVENFELCTSAGINVSTHSTF